MTSTNGNMDKLITLQALVQTKVNGELQKSWAQDSPPDSVWAEYKPLVLKKAEAFEAARNNARELATFRIRYRSDVDTTWRIVFSGQNYGIKHIDRSKRRQGEMTIMAECVGFK